MQTIFPKRVYYRVYGRQGQLTDTTTPNLTGCPSFRTTLRHKLDHIRRNNNNYGLSVVCDKIKVFN